MSELEAVAGLTSRIFPVGLGLGNTVLQSGFPRLIGLSLQKTYILNVCPAGLNRHRKWPRRHDDELVATQYKEFNFGHRRHQVAKGES